VAGSEASLIFFSGAPPFPARFTDPVAVAFDFGYIGVVQ
jgi:hypothetical protein